MPKSEAVSYWKKFCVRYSRRSEHADRNVLENKNRTKGGRDTDLEQASDGVLAFREMRTEACAGPRRTELVRFFRHVAVYDDQTRTDPALHAHSRLSSYSIATPRNAKHTATLIP